MSAETLVNELVNTVKSEVSKSSEKLNKFIDEYNSKFENKAYGGDIYILSQVILPLLRGCLMLYTLNMNGQVILDLAGILERYAIMLVVELFHSFPDRQRVVEKLIEKKFLNELAELLIMLGLWDKSDKKSITRLKKIRDGIAHKNVKTISKMLNDGKIVSVLDIDVVMSKKDVLSYMLDTINLLLKLFRRYSTKTDRGIIAQKMIDGEINDESEVFKLFMS
jgi:hypothetical protein